MEKANEEGRKFGEDQHKANPFKKETTIDKNSVLSEAQEIKEDPPETTDPKLLETIHTYHEDKNKGDSLEEDVLVDSMIATGDKLSQDPTATVQVEEIKSTEQDSIVPCIESKKVPLQSYFKVLNIEINHQDEKKEYVPPYAYRKCVGNLNHPNNHPDCNNFEVVVEKGYYRTIQAEKTEERRSYWTIEDSGNLLQKIKTNQCNVIKSQCVDNKTRYYHGKAFDKPCWREEFICVLSPEQKENSCSALRKRGCIELTAVCSEYASDGSGACETWEKTYQCPTYVAASLKNTQDGIHCIDGGNLVKQPTQYNDMASALAQLQALSEIQKDVIDAKDFKVFKGGCKRCKQNILENVLYDCCRTRTGLAIDLGLTSCSPEEQDLAQFRTEGKCHYVGTIENKLADCLWHSSNTHVYCCYPSKLVAIIQREARKQLRKTFGTAEKPDCDGLSINDINKLNFSTMDLSELFDDIMEKAKKDTQTADTSNMEARMQTKLKTTFKYVDKRPQI